MKATELSLTIATLSVEVKTLVLDGKRFTKSVFSQLQEKMPGQGFQIVGFVVEQDGRRDSPGYDGQRFYVRRWLIFVYNGRIYKHCPSYSSLNNADNSYYREVNNLDDSLQLFISI